MLCAIERTSVPPAMDACEIFLREFLARIEPPSTRSTSSRAGIEPCGLIEDRLEVRRHDEMREQLLVRRYSRGPFA